MSTPTRRAAPPAHAQSAAAAVNTSPRITIHAAARRRGNQKAGAPHKDEGEVYLHLLEQYENNSVALICCVNKYPNAKEGHIKLKDLDCAIADGKKLAAMLRAQGFQVLLLLDQDVTQENINRHLVSIMRKYSHKSPTIGRFYMMLAGHGLKDDATGSSVFCCHDFTADNEYGTSYPLDELKKKLQHIGLKHQCVHLDCCHAGGIFSANRSREADFNVLQHAQGPVVQAITAVTRDEQALETNGNGIFTKHLCEEVENEWIFDKWGADVVTLSQLFNVTRNKVVSEARESGGQMTPMHKDVLNQHLKEQCCGEMLFFRPGTTKEAWALKKSAPVAEKKAATERGAAAPAPTLTPEMQAWAQAQKIQGVQALANAMSEFGVAEVTDLELLDKEDVTKICGALKKVDAKKFKKAVDKPKASAAQPVKPVPVEEEVQAAAAAVPAEANEEELPPMSAEEAKVIEEALAKMANGETELWSLRGNQIGDVGASKIADALPQSKLTSLNLRFNQIGDAGAIAIADALPQSKLTWLNLEDNQIGDAVKQRLEQCKNAEGKSIDIDL